MKNLVTGCLLLSLFALACNQPLDCKQFRNGTFNIVVKDYVSTVVRNGDQQIELAKRNINERDTIERDTFKVKWINDCQYTLTPTQDCIKRNHIPRPDAVTTVDIVNTSGNRCLINVSYNFSRTVLEGRMIKEK